MMGLEGKVNYSERGKKEKHKVRQEEKKTEKKTKRHKVTE